MRAARQELPATLGQLRSSEWCEPRLATRGIKDELRENLICRLQNGADLFPGIVGYQDSVVPQIVNAVLSRHNFILLGLRGQAKTRIIRMLTTLLDDAMPYLAGTEIRDNPYNPVSAQGRHMVQELGDEAAIAWLSPGQRYIEKLATPDVTIADMIGDIDPIKAARRGQDISDELTIHYGLLPRANRGIFAINELPDLAGKIQVGLFNIMQEGDVQIKGYPVRLPLDILLVFTANPEDYTARGKIITPLKDRIGSEIRTHYPVSVEEGVAITRQEAWASDRPSPVAVVMSPYLSEVIEQIAFLARDDKKVDKRSGVSQRLPISVTENVISNAERRSLVAGEDAAVARIVDLYAALPSITGKIELEYEGELKGNDQVARELVRGAVARVFNHYFDGISFSQVVQWFELGGSIRLDENASSTEIASQLGTIQGLMEKTGALGLGPNESDAMRVAAAEFILEGLCSHRRLTRNEERVFSAGERKRDLAEEEEPKAGRKRADARRHYQ
jgi:magnesium chelatase subunit I